MKKVLLVFFGLVLLSQVLQVWERGHPAASVKRHMPVKIYQTPAGHGHGGPNRAVIMIAWVQPCERSSSFRSERRFVTGL